MTKQEQFEMFYRKTLVSVCDNYKMMSESKYQEGKIYFDAYAQGQLLALIRFAILLKMDTQILNEIESLLYKVN